MSLTGIIKNGVVVLPPDVHLEEGQTVEVLAGPASPEDNLLRELARTKSPPRNLPDDLAINHDYYLHGHDRKQQPRTGRWISAIEPAPEVSDSQAEQDATQYLQFAAQVHDLPADLAENHDHYLHGRTKQ